MKKTIALVMILAVAFAAFATGSSELPVSTTKTQTPVAEPVKEVAKELVYAKGTTLRMATGYNSASTGLSFDAGIAGAGVTLPDGVTYHAGDLKPTWVEVQNVLGIKIEDKYQGNSATNELKYWAERLGEVDIVSGNAVGLQEYGEAGKIINIAEYLDYMPNFKAYLDANPIVRLSITGNTNNGAIYFSPYFDGVNDIERMPLMRVDFVEKLLDGAGKFTATKSGKTAAPVYEPYMPASGKIAVDVVEKDGKTVKTIYKDYDKAGNIVAKMNAKGAMSGVDAVNMLRDYIDQAYNGYYGTKRSDLFIGQNAAWDADELVALLRCVVANAYTLNGTDTIQGLFSREDSNNQRRIDMYRFAGNLFGVRGVESRQEWMYFGTDGKLHDVRQETAVYEALERMNDMVKEGLISKSFVDSSNETSKTMLQNDLGFMHYDYNQTQTLYNDPSQKVLDAGEKYMAVMVPVARWYDGTDPNGVYMRFTESWRSVKTDAWGLSKEGIGNDQDKLFAALKIIDYAYSPEGIILMSYGPAVYRKTGATFMFNGTEMPVIADATWDALWALGKGNYTNFARQYLGSTLSFAKSQAFEYQCTTEAGKQGAGYISTAIGLGTIKHPELAVCDNMWYTSVPTTLPLTKAESDMAKSYTDLSATNWSTSKGGVNYFVDLIAKGYTVPGMSDAVSAANTVKTTFSGAQWLQLQNDAWNRLLKFYNSL